jgi:hypothetical protein
VAVVLQGGYDVVSRQILPIPVYGVSIPQSKGLKYYAPCAHQNIRIKGTEDLSHLGLELCDAELVVLDVSKQM